MDVGGWLRSLGLVVTQRNMGLVFAATEGALPGVTWLYFAMCRVSRASPVQTACATVREMKEGPSRPEVRFWSQATASCCRQERWW